MKKLLLLTLTSLCGAASALAQITINATDFAQVGDTLYYAYDTNLVSTSIVLESGSGRRWDMSNAMKNEVKPTYFLNPANSPIPAPTNITHVLVEGDAQNTQFINLSNTQMETVFPNPLAAFTGGDAFVRLKTLSFPSTYLSQVRDTFKSVQVLPASLLGISGIADSVRITFTVKLHNICDAWGTLITPVDSYPTIRFKNTVNIDFKIDGKKNPFPVWVPIPTSSLPFELPSNQDNVSLIWVHQNGKYFLAESTLVPDDDGTQEEFRYQTPKPDNTTGLLNRTLGSIETNVYPNPANNELTIDAKLKSTETYQLEVSDLMGRVIKTETISGQSTQIKVNVSILENGVYFAKLSNNTSVANIKFVVSK